MNPVILASASPRRKQLFQMMGISADVDPSDIEEIIENDLSPGEVVCSLARQKAHDVAGRHQDRVLVAADTIVVHNNTILGKPASTQEAEEMLDALSNTSHDVLTGVSVLNLEPAGAIRDEVTFFSQTKVTFSPLQHTEIRKYVATGNPMDKAGAYGIQDDYGSLFIKKIEGDYYNVVGFPVNLFYQTLKNEYSNVFKKIFSA